MAGTTSKCPTIPIRVSPLPNSAHPQNPSTFFVLKPKELARRKKYFRLSAHSSPKGNIRIISFSRNTRICN